LALLSSVVTTTVEMDFPVTKVIDIEVRIERGIFKILDR
jgi:hypothetical protein